LEFAEPVENLNDVGGLKNLKKWIERKTTIIKNLGEATEFGVDISKAFFFLAFRVAENLSWQRL